MVYLSKVDKASTADGSTGFFKIYEDGWKKNPYVVKAVGLFNTSNHDTARALLETMISGKFHSVLTGMWHFLTRA